MKITIGHLYPELLNLYGDRGNIQCMKKRLEWRGIDVEVIEYQLEDEINFSDLDIVLLGGGSDREQILVSNKLFSIKDDLKRYVEEDGVLIAVCGGYQLLGDYYQTNNGTIKGLSIVDIYTEQKPGRLINNIITKNKLFQMPIVGFENHGGRTFFGAKAEPLGKVIYGSGNNGETGDEGVIYKNVIGTYLHGPLLPKNPHLCDFLLKKALIRKYGEGIELAELDDSQEIEANSYIVKRFLKKDINKL